MPKLNSDFFENKSTIEIASELIGKVIVHKTKNGILKGIINETEAYLINDEASHSYKGKITKKNEIMFKDAGHLYIYFTYGMHYCANIVTNKKNRGEAVLIRSVIPILGKNIMIKNRKGNLKHIADGPAKFCQAFELNKNYNGINLLNKNSLIYLEDLNYFPNEIKKTTRIGISKAKDLELRFIAFEF